MALTLSALGVMSCSTCKLLLLLLLPVLLLVLLLLLLLLLVLQCAPQAQLCTPSNTILAPRAHRQPT